MNATLIPSSSVNDHEARWARHRRRKPSHGYKAHVATDQNAGLIRGVEVTTANKHDASELAVILPNVAGETFNDTAYQSDWPERIIHAPGRTAAHRAHGRDRRGGSGKRLRAHNAKDRRVRCRTEKVFGTAKRSYGLRRMRWLRLAKAGLKTPLTAIAYTKTH